MKKKIALVLAPIAFTCTVQANMACEVKDLKERVAALEQGKAPISTSRSEIQDGSGLFFTVEGLYWQATQKGMTYAIKGFNDGSAFSPNIENGKSKKPEFDWTGGFRLGLGYNIPHGGWDLYSSWTHFRFNAHSHDSIAQSDPGAIPGDFLSPFWIAKIFPFNQPGILNTARAHWKLHLDIVDLELGKEFFVGQWLSLRPLVGLRAAWINQDYNIRFFRQTPADPVTPIPATTSRWLLDMENDFWGMGIRAGLDTKWLLGKGWGIYGNAAISLLDGHFHNRFKQRAHGLFGTFETDDLFKNKSTLHTDVAITDLALGFSWEKAVSEGRYTVALWAGYEQHLFFEQNQFMNFQYDFTIVIADPSVEGPNYYTDGGNLTTHGVVFGFEFGF